MGGDLDLDAIKARTSRLREDLISAGANGCMVCGEVYDHHPECSLGEVTTDLAALVAHAERTCPGEEKCNGRWLAATLQGATLALGPHADHPHDWVLRGEDGGPVCDGLSHCPWCGGRLA